MCSDVCSLSRSRRVVCCHRPRCLEVHSQKRNNDPFNFERDMKDMFSKDNFGKNMFNRGSANSSMFDNSNDYFGDAKKLYAEGERMFRNGQFQQGQRLFQEAEQQLRQAKSKLPFPPFDSRKADYNSPTDPISNKKTWKASSLAVLGIGALAALVAGECQCAVNHYRQACSSVKAGLQHPIASYVQHCLQSCLYIFLPCTSLLAVRAASLGGCITGWLHQELQQSLQTNNADQLYSIRDQSKPS